jgi:hypothetical protein
LYTQHKQQSGMKKQIIFLTLSLSILVVLSTILGFHTVKHLTNISTKADTQNEISVSSTITNKTENISSIKKIKQYKKDKIETEVKTEEIQQISYAGPSLFELANELNVQIGNIEEPINEDIPADHSNNNNILSLAELIGLYGIKSF